MHLVGAPLSSILGSLCIGSPVATLGTLREKFEYLWDSTDSTDSTADCNIMEEVLFIETITNSNTSFCLSSLQSECQNFVLALQMVRVRSSLIGQNVIYLTFM